jgi:general secretion pathway protein N
MRFKDKAKQLVLWGGLALLSVVTAILLFLPASWVGIVLEKQTNGRISLGDVQGSFWAGSAFVGVAADKNGPLTPLFPGRFAWKISPLILLGQIVIELENSAVMSPNIKINGDFSQLHVSSANLSLPSERLEGLGAPLNTIGPSGKIDLHWDELDVLMLDRVVSLSGKMQLKMDEMASRASSIKPLGSYLLDIHWQGESANLMLKTTRGPMMLEGIGGLNKGKFHFSGKAYADKGQEEKLANLLNLLGRRRQEGDKQIIALEYK